MFINIFQVRGNLKKLDSEQQTLNALWKEKERWLKELLNLQLLNTEAERIDAATKGHEAFLELSNLGVLFCHIFKDSLIWILRSLIWILRFWNYRWSIR